MRAGTRRAVGGDPITAGEVVDAIVTDLPYGVRSAAVGVGDGPNAVCTPRDMLLALLDLANARLRRGGRVAAWLRNPGDGADVNENIGKDGAGGTAAALTEADVAAAALTRGFWVERAAGEARKTGVSRALYVMVRVEEAGCRGCAGGRRGMTKKKTATRRKSHFCRRAKPSEAWRTNSTVARW